MNNIHETTGSPEAAEVHIRGSSSLSHLLPCSKQIQDSYFKCCDCSLKQDEMWKTFSLLKSHFPQPHESWNVLVWAFCLSEAWGLVWGVGWFGVFFHFGCRIKCSLCSLNNKLYKKFSWLLYLGFSYINCFPLPSSSSSSPCWHTESPGSLSSGGEAELGLSSI